ncbi:MAG TPA: hypothetical protein PKC83_07070 [Gemmatimonadaceae bacterium]|jgi:hypothetical protein|nr:MAG: hypothetical protein ABS52_05740 [Gemmatimonadetes bacterium SCN 70-22]HMN08534.1 hypothetical protein [Gemmatimonadaceae bacterium]
MVKILADGDNGHRLENADGRTIASIRNRAIRLYGLGSEQEAVSVVVALWHVLDAVLFREFPGWRRHEPVIEDLHLVHDGAYEWITDGRKPLARLYRERRGRATPFAIEYVLPSYASEGVAISAAQLMARALDELLHVPLDAA